VIEKIITGKLEKYYAETCLMEQAFIKEPERTVLQLVNDAIAKLGENVVVRRFARFQVGEQN
jgi:elongation factor Ts